MNNSIQIIVFGLLSAFTLIAFFQVVSAFFPRLIAKSIHSMEVSPFRTFLLGLANIVFLVVIFLLFYALGENTGVQVYFLPALIVVLIVAPLVSIALSAIVGYLSERLLPTSNRVRRMNYGGAAFLLACAVPYVGWFGLLPATIIFGFGGVINGLFQILSDRKSTKEETNNHEKPEIEVE